MFHAAAFTRAREAAQFRITPSMERNLMVSESLRGGRMERRAGYSVKPAREDASAGLRILAMLSLKRAGEEGSATPPSDPSCPVPDTKGLPHLQGRETIAGIEDPSSRVIIPPLQDKGRQWTVGRAGQCRLEVCQIRRLPSTKEVVPRSGAHGFGPIDQSGVGPLGWTDRH